MNFKHNYRRLFTAAILVITFQACELPDSPDFNMEHSLDLPLIKNISYPFMGGTEAIIDTTSESFIDLFEVEPDGLVKISTKFDFDLGNFSDAVPEVNTEPVEVRSEIGLLDISFEGTGASDFENTTGIPSDSQPSQGEHIPAGTSNGIEIELDIEQIDQGVVESGAIRIDFENNLGFTIEQIDAQLVSNGVIIGSPITLSNIENGDSASDNITLSEEEVINIPLNVVFDIQWQSQTMSGEPDNLNINVEDDDLFLKSATAIIKEQDFYSNGGVLIDESDLVLNSTSHFIELEDGLLNITDISNTIDLDINLLQISFPNILLPPYNPGDSLVVKFEGSERIRRSSTNIPDKEIELKDVRIYALDNEINYNVSGYTEDTNESPVGDQKRIVSSEDSFNANIIISNLLVSQVEAIVTPKFILLGDDDQQDGNLDLFNQDEVSITEVSEFETLSNNISNLSFFQPELVLNIETNTLVDNAVYAAILGINTKGEQVYLKASEGSPFAVVPSDSIDGLSANGVALGKDQLLRIEVSPSEINADNIASLRVVFSPENSNISDFISNFPTEIRFIGKSLINPDSKDGNLSTPVIFNTDMSVDVPLVIGIDGLASYSDTLDTDLTSIPGADDDQILSDATLRLDYSNGLPLSVGLHLEFINEDGEVITTIPLSESSDEDLLLESADIDPGTRFSDSPNNDRIFISLNREQLLQLNQAVSISLVGNLSTPETNGSSEIRIRSNDELSFSLYGKFKLETKIGN